MRFGILGPLAVWGAGGALVRVPEAKVRALLADLLLHRGEVVPAVRLLDDVWGEGQPANPDGVLRAKLSQLRRVLEEAAPGGRDLLVHRPPGYLLDVAADAVDAGRFQQLLSRAGDSAGPRVRAELLGDALALWRGPALADFRDEEFARPAIVRLEEQRLTALEDQAEARLALGEHGALIGELADLVHRHPLRERFRAAHMRALYRAGRQGEALDVYAAFRDGLREELGLDPGPGLTALHQAILRQDPDLLSAAAARTNLPAPLTGLIGRTAALAEARDLLAASRLVTLTGPGGVGKTRLALAAAAQLTETFPDGVWLIELAAIGPSGGPVTEAVAAVLGLRDEATAGSLARAVHGRRVLLVLDNCEHVIEQVAELSGLLLRAAPGLRILATSQEPLGVSGERLLVVPPLEPSSAERLFVARATAGAPGFTLDDGNAAAVAAICRRLDGIPLALELAATRVRTLGAAELAGRLDDRFRLLAAGSRAAPPRQRTLRAMIDWSWELLTGPERTVLRRLAVHAGGCTLEAAEAVCAGAGLDAADVIDLLDRLVNRSLVVVADGPRYRLLETVAAYCTECLHEAGEAEPVRRRHLGYYTELAEHADRRLRSREQRSSLGRLDAETANLRGALEGACRSGDAEHALRLAGAQAWYWYLRGRLAEARRSLDAALALEGGPAADAARAKALAWRTAFALIAGDEADAPDQVRAALEPYERLDEPGALAMARWVLGSSLFGFGDRSTSAELVEQALATFRALGDRWGAAASLNTMAWHALTSGDLAAVQRYAEESHAQFIELGDEWGQSQAAENLGVLAEIKGDVTTAVWLHRAGLRLAEELGLWTDVPFKLSELGQISLRLGHRARARELHERARRLSVEHSIKLGEINALIGLGQCARREGDLALADRLLRGVLDWHRQMGYQPWTAMVMTELGFVAEQRGDTDEALRLHIQGHDAARAAGDPQAVALALTGLAGAHALAGRHTHAAEHLGAAARTLSSAGAVDTTDASRITANVRAALGEQAFKAAFSH